MSAVPVDPRFGPGREFAAIRSFLAGSSVGPDVLVGPGDDAAVLEGGTVVSTDLAVEGIHFHLDWISAEEAGYRSAAAGMSDLAAMGADPVAVLVSVAAIRDGAAASAAMTGVRRLVDEVGGSVVGGDLTRSSGPLVLDIVSIGRTSDPLLRSEAHVGDEVWVTGRLGGAAGAVALWRGGRPVPDTLRFAFTAPIPRIQEALWLREAGATAAIDVSDGVAGDAGHLAAASDVALVLDAWRIPVHPALESAELTDGTTPLDLALHGGDDFELLFTVPPGGLDGREGDFEERFRTRLTRVGTVESGTGVGLRREEGSDPVPLDRGGFDHFSGGAGA